MKCGTLSTVSPGDTIVLLSKSGNSMELVELVPHLRSRDSFVILVTCLRDSLLGQLSDYQVFLPLCNEVCPLNLAPLSSPTLYLLFADLCKRYALDSQPCLLSTLAQSLPTIPHSISFLKVKDLMLPLSSLPVVNCDSRCVDALSILNNAGKGFVLVVNTTFELIVVFTDTDLRTALFSHGSCILEKSMLELTTRSDRLVKRTQSLREALAIMNLDPTMSFLPVVTNKTGSPQVCGVIFRQNVLLGSFLHRPV